MINERKSSHGLRGADRGAAAGARRGSSEGATTFRGLPRCDAAGPLGDAVLAEAASLRRRADVVIAIGHCGYRFDADLFRRAAAERARRGRTVDAVVGGHTHLIRSSNGRDYGEAPVVAQAGVSGSHLGILELDLAARDPSTGLEVAAARSRNVPLRVKGNRGSDMQRFVDAELKAHAAPPAKPRRTARESTTSQSRGYSVETPRPLAWILRGDDAAPPRAPPG